MPETILDSEQFSSAPDKKPTATEMPLESPEPCTPQTRGSRRLAACLDEARHPQENEHSLDLPGSIDTMRFSQQMQQTILPQLKQHIDQCISEVKLQNRRDNEMILMAIQQESTKRFALEQRLYSNLLAQSETMVAMELKLLRLEAQLERRDPAHRNRVARTGLEGQTTLLNDSPAVDVGTTNVAFSSAISLASGVTAESFTRDVENVERLDENNQSTDPGDVDSQRSTPTLGSRSNNPISGGNLESVLLNPMFSDGHSISQSTRATRGDGDGNSSLGTSVTGSTLTATITTRPESAGRLDSTRADSVRGRYLSLDPESRRTTSALTVDSQEMSIDGGTNQSYTADITSVGSGASQSTAIMSSVAVAAPRVRRALRGETAPDSRPLANRVVSFTTDLLQNQQTVVNNEHCDSITMPDELDNLSEVADTFAASARTWREEYEARLEALQKRMVSE